jgi:hypothetical protein
MIDAFSSYVECVPTPNKEAPTIYQAFLSGWVAQHSFCDRLNSGGLHQLLLVQVDNLTIGVVWGRIKSYIHLRIYGYFPLLCQIKC